MRKRARAVSSLGDTGAIAALPGDTGDTSTVSTPLIREIVAVGTRSGLPLEELLADLGPRAAELDYADARVPAALVGKMWRGLSERVPGKPHALAPWVNPIHALGAVAYLARAASTGRQALRDIADFAQLISTHLELSVDENPRGDVRLRYIHIPSIEQIGHPVEFGLNLIARLVVDDPGGIASLSLKHGPFGEAGPYQRSFGESVRFERERTELCLRAEALDRQRPSADPRLAACLRTHLESVRGDSAPAQRFPQRLQQCLRALANDGVFQVRAVAAHLHMSERHLQRLAQRHGLEMRALIREHRQQQATRLLRNVALDLTDIAERLDYADVRAFNRAFKRWTGLTPARWRAQNVR